MGESLGTTLLTLMAKAKINQLLLSLGWLRLKLTDEAF